MKFSDNGYYIEQYVKCDNCGVLIYDQGIHVETRPEQIFCSNWCVEWRSQCDAGIETPNVSIPFDV